MFDALIQTIVMGIAPKPSGFSSTKAGKQAILDRTKALVEKSSMIITLPFEGVSKESVDILRKAMPEETAASVVKNSLMKLSLDGTEFESLKDFCSYENMYIFIPEGKAKATFKAIKSWQKDVDRKDKEFDANCAVMDGVIYQGPAVEDACNLPTKEELITKIAIGIKAPTVKLGMSIRAVPNKLGRAFGALKKKLEEEEGSA